MLRADVAVIGGTGVGERLASRGGKRFCITTPHGQCRGRLTEIDGLRVALIERHSAGHRTPPHAVGYAAMADASRRMGIRACLSSAAVGSLRQEWAPGTLVACDDLIDLSGRNLTLFARDVVHTPVSKPFPLYETIQSAVDCQSGTYVNANGPRFEAPEEIRMMQRLGGDVVGMTAGTEAIVCAEAGVPYGCLAIVTNFGEGMAPEGHDHEGVRDVALQNADRIVDALVKAASRVVD